MRFVVWAFFLIGLNQLVWSFIEYSKLSDPSISFMKAGKLFFTSGGIFMLVGIFLFFLFSAKANIFVRKRKMVVAGAGILHYEQLHALQVLEKFIQGNSSGSYYSYELNLVTKTGERYNLLNHGDKMFLLSDMAKLSKLLNLPVWNMGVA